MDEMTDLKPAADECSDAKRPARWGSGVMLAAGIAAMLALGTVGVGCEREGPAEQAGEAVDEAAEDVGDAVDDATDGR